MKRRKAGLSKYFSSKKSIDINKWLKVVKELAIRRLNRKNKCDEKLLQIKKKWNEYQAKNEEKIIQELKCNEKLFGLFSGMNLYNIEGRIGKNDEEIINTFLSVGLIRKRKDIKCNSCNQMMKIDTTKGCFRFRYICKNKSHKKAVILNPFDRTIFYKSKSKIKDIIILLFQYLRRDNIETIKSDINMNRSTILDWFFRFRSAMGKLLLNDHIKIGGPKYHIQIEESYKNRKFNLGRNYPSTIKKYSVFGAICQETREFYAEIVHDTKRDTIFESMKKNIAPGCYIYSDGAKIYQNITKNLPELEIAGHEIVIHKKGQYFKYSLLEHDMIVTTNLVDCIWRSLKKGILSWKSTRIVQSYIDLYLFRYRYLNHLNDYGLKLAYFLLKLFNTPEINFYEPLPKTIKKLKKSNKN